MEEDDDNDGDPFDRKWQRRCSHFSLDSDDKRDWIAFLSGDWVESSLSVDADDSTGLDAHAVKIRSISGPQSDPANAFLLLKTVCEVFPNTRTARYGTDLVGFVVAEVVQLFGAYLWCLDTLGFLSQSERVVGMAALDIIRAKDPVDDI